MCLALTECENLTLCVPAGKCRVYVEYENGYLSSQGAGRRVSVGGDEEREENLTSKKEKKRKQGCGEWGWIGRAQDGEKGEKD